MVSPAESLEHAVELQQRLDAERARDRAYLDQLAPHGRLNTLTARDHGFTPTRMIAAGWVLKQRTDGAHWERGSG